MLDRAGRNLTFSDSLRNIGDFLAACIIKSRLGSALDAVGIYHDFLDVLHGRCGIHGIHQRSLHDRTQTTGTSLSGNCLCCNRVQGIVRQFQFNVVEVEQLLILLRPDRPVW